MVASTGIKAVKTAAYPHLNPNKVLEHVQVPVAEAHEPSTPH